MPWVPLLRKSCGSGIGPSRPPGARSPIERRKPHFDKRLRIVKFVAGGPGRGLTTAGFGVDATYMSDRRPDQEKIDESLEESFPASDPPSHSGVTPSPEEAAEDEDPVLDPELPD